MNIFLVMVSVWLKMGGYFAVFAEEPHAEVFFPT
jgi:hypothetical protein